jgi:transcriptional regulator with XRE-family HTH domain
VKKFSERLRHFRKNVLKTTLRAFAEQVGTSQGYLHELESGKKECPSSEFLQRICETFGVRRAWLESGTGEMLVGAFEAEGQYRFDLKTNLGAKAAFEWFLEKTPLPVLIGRLAEILNDESQTPAQRLEIAKAMMPVIERRQNEPRETSEKVHAMPVQQRASKVR